MRKINEDNLNPEAFDLGVVRKNGNQLDEFVLTMFGGWVKKLLGAMFDGSSVPVSVRGSKREISSFTDTLGREKRYMEMFKKYGLDDPRTFKSKAKLNKAVGNFERTTSLKWPFK